LTSEQLQSVRAERWRHTANPLLTADDARAWLDAAGLVLFLPRRTQFLTPAPSFVEACAGAPSETPIRAQIDNAADLMRRLAAEGAVLPLNLFGTPSETPDFLASREAFPYLYSLRGTRDWKTEPAGKSSPLVIEIWKHLEKEGPLTAGQIQSALGRELTEAAVLRGLMEMWSNLRVLPEYESATKTRWNLTQARYKTELNAAAKTSQTTALSALVSLYLESVLAATSEEVETFLSPLTARSRVRETVNGLAATRQLSLVPVGTQSMFHITGALPEFAEPEIPETIAAGAAAAEGSEAAPQTEHAPRTFTRKPFEKKTGERKTFGRKAVERAASAEGERKPYPRKEAAGAGGDRKPFTRRPAFGKKPFDREAGGDRPTYRPAARSTEGGKFPPKRFGAKPFGAKPPARKFEDRPSRPSPRPEGEAAERKSSYADRPRTFRPREGAADKRPGSFAGKPKFGAPKKFDGPRSTGPRTGGFKSTGTKFGGPKKFGAPKFGPKGKQADGEKRPFFRKRPEAGAEGESRPRNFSRPSSSRPSYNDKSASRTGFSSRTGGPPSRGTGAGPRTGAWKPKPSTGARFTKPGGSYNRPRPAGSDRSDSPERSERPRTPRPFSGSSEKPSRPGGYSKPPFAKTGKPGFAGSKPSGGAFGGKKFAGKPTGGSKFGGAKKFGSGPKNFAPRKPAGKFGGKPAGRSGPKPGGTRPPFRKRKDEGGTSSE
jgi:hypothetical protein